MLPPSRDDATLRREREEFETFGERRHLAAATAAQRESSLEDWQVMDDWQLLDGSAAGLRLTRPLRLGVRVGAGLLVAVQAAGSRHFALGKLCWALRHGSDAIAAGIRLFPEEVRPATMRVVDPGAPSGPWQRAFLLGEGAAAAEPGSIVVPAGIFRIGRRIDLMADGQVRALKLLGVLDRGIEFEHCSIGACA
jgi:hypothetical protein